MTQFEYKVIPTPRRPRRAKGVKGVPAQFANVLTEAINAEAADGWEFYKTETLPMEARPSLFRAPVESFQSVMVFRRDVKEIKATPEENLHDSGSLLAVPVADSAPAQLVDNRSDLPVFERNEPPLGGFGAPDGEAANAADADSETKADAPVDDGSNDTDARDSADEDLTFDKDDRDPLKDLVEANRGANGTK